jgi:hypothetical protein
MLQRLLIIVVLAAPPIGLIYWDGHGHPLPRWSLVLSALPFFIWAIVNDDEENDYDGDSAAARFYLAVGSVWMIVASLIAIVVGAAGWALRGQGSLLELFAFALPAGVILLVVALLRLWFSRS